MTTERPVTPDSAYGYIPRHAAGSGIGGPPAPPGVGHDIPRWSAYVTLTRERANPNEESIQHERFPFYDQDYIGSHHDTLVNWTDCGPIRPSLHMRQETINRQVGTSNTRNQDPWPITTYGIQDSGHGMHTTPEGYKQATNRNFRARQQQQPARINRLSPAVYTGQSYSQTTVVQGGSR